MNITKFRKVIDKTDFEKIDRKTVYDTYVGNYNKAKDRVQYLSVLMTVADGYEKQIKNIEKHISRDILGIFQPLNNIRENIGTGKFTLSEIGKKEFKKVHATNYNEADFIDEKVTDLRDTIDAFLDEFKNGYRNEWPEIYSIDNFLVTTIEEFQELIEGFTFHDIYPELLRDAIYWNALHFKTGFHRRVLDQIIQQVTEKNFEELKTYSELSESKREALNKKEYVPHHNVREGLIEDLQTIISDIKDKKRFFHNDGSIKHTTVASHAVDQKWFTDKHGFGTKGLHDHIKKLWEIELQQK